jgi:hypothetical protein
MQVAVGLGRCIIVDDNVDTLNIDTTTKDIGGHQNTLFEIFEGLVTIDTKIQSVMVAESRSHNAYRSS